MKQGTGKGTRSRRKKATKAGTLVWSPTCGRFLPRPVDADVATVVKEPPQVIGSVTSYTGTERRFGGRGARVKITGVLCRGRNLGSLPEDEEAGYLYVTDDVRLMQLGGVQAGDGVECHFWLEPEGHWGFVGHEIPDASDLALFAALKVKKAPTTPKK